MYVLFEMNERTRTRAFKAIFNPGNTPSNKKGVLQRNETSLSPFWKPL